MLGLVALFLAGDATAATLDEVAACQAVTGEDRARVERLAATQYLYDCCDDTVAACLAVPEPCPLAERLAGEICRLVEAGRTDVEIDQALKLRARSMMPGGPTATFDLEGAPVMGPPEAPVELVMFACIRCPFCGRMTLELEEQVQGELAGKVRWYVKLFPLKGHPGAVESALAALAAHDQGKFWPFVHLAYDRFGAFSVEKLGPWAEEVGLDMAAYQQTMDDPMTRERLVASKREGIHYGVRATPTLFINGRPYVAELRTEQVVDAILEEYERLTPKEQ
jgi:protein-disulfide isomerase